MNIETPEPRRIIRGAAAILSLGVAMSALVLWVRGATHLDVLARTTPDAGGIRSWTLWSSGGHLVAIRTHSNVSRPGAMGWHFVSQLHSPEDDFSPIPRPRSWDWGGSMAGFAVGRATDRSMIHYGGTMPPVRPVSVSHIVVFPVWILVFPFLPLPLLQLAVFARSRLRRRACACKHCGYDLRGSISICPECGK